MVMKSRGGGQRVGMDLRCLEGTKKKLAKSAECIYGQEASILCCETPTCGAKGRRSDADKEQGPVRDEGKVEDARKCAT